MSKKLEIVFNPEEDINKINEKVLKLKKINKEEFVYFATFSMLSDSFKKKSKVYKIKNPIKNNKEIPRLILL